MLFRKEKIDEKTRIYHILGIKIKLAKKSVRISKMTKTKRDDALITLKCIRNLAAKINNVQTIVLGSSSARMGFIENETSINFKTSNEICKKYKNVQIYNAYSDDCYEKDDFRDLNYLSRSRAEKMTAKINEFLGGEL